MLAYAVVFFVIALVAAVFGFAGITPAGGGIAKILFFVFLILAVVSFIADAAGAPDKPAKPKKQSQAEVRAARLARLRELFPMGREFRYLSLWVRVVGHQQWSWDNSEWWAVLKVEYVAGAKILSHELTLEECEALHRDLAVK
jgi:uncharacterized membrane protein YtjA (UPF0391 family)